VRAAGLGFGLWMEPERFAPLAPILKEHADWFFPGDREYRRIDLENPQAYAWLKGEVFRLVQTYQLAWMKVDFNFELGSDPARRELRGYYQCWYRLLDEIRAAFPNTFCEGCASGGMRSDIQTLAHFDNHFLSDTVNPIDVLRIKQGAWLRLPPGRMSSWVVIRSVGNDVPWYSDAMGDQWPPTIITPEGAGWEMSESVNVAFAAAVTLLGMSGISGDIANLPQSARDELRRLVAFYKKWRRFICGSLGSLLTPPQPKEDRSGWVYRLYDWRKVQVFHPQGLDPAAFYLVQREDAAGEGLRLSGEALMSHGLEVSLDHNYRAAIYSIQPE
jgi:alpha-galactosidase